MSQNKKETIRYFFASSSFIVFLVVLLFVLVIVVVVVLLLFLLVVVGRIAEGTIQLRHVTLNTLQSSSQLKKSFIPFNITLQLSNSYLTLYG